VKFEVEKKQIWTSLEELGERAVETGYEQRLPSVRRGEGEISGTEIKKKN